MNKYQLQDTVTLLRDLSVSANGAIHADSGTGIHIDIEAKPLDDPSGFVCYEITGTLDLFDIKGTDQLGVMIGFRTNDATVFKVPDTTSHPRMWCVKADPTIVYRLVIGSIGKLWDLAAQNPLPRTTK